MSKYSIEYLLIVDFIVNFGVQSLNRENFNFLYSLDFFILKIELPKP